MNKCIRNQQLRFILIILTFSNIANSQDSLKYAIKVNSDFNSNVNIYNPKILYYPSFMYQTKKQKWREIQLWGIFRNKDIYRYTNPLEVFGTDVHSLVFLNVITHTNLIKNKNSKLKIFYSVNTRLGYGRFRHEPKSNVSYYVNKKLLNIGYGLSSRIGYNLTNRIYLEIAPPLGLKYSMIIGKKFLDNPLLAVNLRNQPIFDLDYHLAPRIKHFSLNEFSFAVAYRF